MHRKNNKSPRIMKIGAFNCHGLREKVDYLDFSKLVANLDIFGVCETWLSDDDDIDLPGYKYYPCNRKDKIGGPTRGGIGIFIKNEIKDYVKLRPDLSSEYFFWCRILKSFLGYEEDVYVGIVYIPSETSTREERLKIDYFKTLKETTAKLKNENIILMGDFNARTMGLDDTLLMEKHESNIPNEFYSKIDSKRCNQDTNGNKYGKKLIEHCVATRSFIVNGRTVGDFQGKLTCHEQSGSSTVDYAVVDENLKSVIQKFEVLDNTMGSDHCPIVLEIEKKTGSPPRKTLPKKPPSIHWNDDNKKKFLNNLSLPEVQNSIVELENMIDGSVDSIEPVIDKLTEIFTRPYNSKNTRKPKHNTAKKRSGMTKAAMKLVRGLN